MFSKILLIFVCVILLVFVLMFLMWISKKMMKSLVVIVSLLARILTGIFLSALFFTLPFFNKILSSGWQVLLIFVGGLLLYFLMSKLAIRFRLVTYSINYLTDSLVVLAFFYLLQSKMAVPFMIYAIVLFIFPRISWILARRTELTSYYREIHDIGPDIIYYEDSVADQWENTSKSWNNIPLQIVLAMIFYLIGSITVVFYFQDMSIFWAVLFFLVITPINVIFDLLVFRNLDAKYDSPNQR